MEASECVRPKRNTRRGKTDTDQSEAVCLDKEETGRKAVPDNMCPERDANPLGAFGDCHLNQYEKEEDAGLANVVGEMRQQMNHMMQVLQGLPQANRNHHEERRNTREQRYRRDIMEDDSSEGDTGSNQSEFQNHRPTRGNGFTKLPAFTGKETWHVWFNRFQEVASLHRWTEGQRLAELLPRLQGVAGEFVYGQLSHTTRTNYRLLVTELQNRFRIVETKKDLQHS